MELLVFDDGWKLVITASNSQSAHEINFVSKLHITKNQRINLTEKNLAVTLIFITFAVTKIKKL